LIVWVNSTRNDSTNPAAPTVTDSLGGNTYTQIATRNYQSTGTRRSTLSAFRCLVATGGTGTITVDFGAATQDACISSVDEFTGMKTSGTNGADAIVQSVTAQGTSSTPTATLSAFAHVNNWTLGFCGTPNIQPAVGTGYTSTFGNGVSSCSMRSQYKGSNDTSVEFGTSITTWGEIAIELAEYRPSLVQRSLSSLSYLGR
jgi:hypothetical protein